MAEAVNQTSAGSPSTSSQLPPSSQQIKTFVFIDLETTGLSDPRITELSMIAVSRDDLILMSTALPITNNDCTPEHRKTSGSEMPNAPVKKPVPESDETVLHARGAKRKLFETPNKNGNQQSVARSTHESSYTETAALQQNVPKFSKIGRKSFYYRVPSIPRIAHKLTKFFNPRKLIYPSVEEITLLNNFKLEELSSLSADFCICFKKFLNFPKPICLVAHNGRRYDFPLIASEFFNSTSCMFSFDDLLYVDSLEALRLLDKISVIEELQDLEPNCSEFSDGDSSSRVGDGVDADDFDESFQPISWPDGNGHQSTSNGKLSTFRSKDPSNGHHSDTLCAPGSSKPVELPSKPSALNPLTSFPPNCSLEDKVELCQASKSYNHGLTPQSKPFSQTNLFHRLFGQDYAAHRAEADCEALLQICGHYGAKFADIADVLKKPLSDIKPMWITSAMQNSPNFKQNWKK